MHCNHRSGIRWWLGGLIQFNKNVIEQVKLFFGFLNDFRDLKHCCVLFKIIFSIPCNIAYIFLVKEQAEKQKNWFLFYIKISILLWEISSVCILYYFLGLYEMFPELYRLFFCVFVWYLIDGVTDFIHFHDIDSRYIKQRSQYFDELCIDLYISRSELLVKWVLLKTRGIKAGMQVILIKWMW